VPWEFSKHSNSILFDLDAVAEALSFVEKEQAIVVPEEWYEVSKPLLERLGVVALLWPLSRLMQALKSRYPNFTWEEYRFSGMRHFGQKALKSCLGSLWPGQELLEDFILSEPSTMVSFYLPKLKLAIDYQHARDYTLALGASSSLALKEDQSKVQAASGLGITLLFIPFWWDRSIYSLAATIIEKNSSLKATMRRSLLDSKLLLSALPIPSQTRIESNQWRRPNISSSSAEGARSRPQGRKPRGLTHEQHSKLLRAFEDEPTPSRTHRELLAKELQLDLTRLETWFRAQRSKK